MAQYTFGALHPTAIISEMPCARHCKGFHGNRIRAARHAHKKTRKLAVAGKNFQGVALQRRTISMLVRIGLCAFAQTQTPIRSHLCGFPNAASRHTHATASLSRPHWL